MAMNPKDLELRDGGRVPKAKYADSARGPEWASKRRDRRMTHEALHNALASFAMKPRTT
jgi:hypothetical protein